jgi:ABC-type Zn uptake system ZnuABC Zn-binding protein ZnuA
MDRRWPAAWLLALLPILILCGCPDSPSARTPGPLRVVATIPPLAGLVRPLIPDGAAVRTLIPQNRSEHGYELTARDVEALAKADVVVYVGLGLDPQVQSFLAKHPSSHRREVCFADAVGVKQTPEAPGHEDHDDDGHHHGGTDPHLWLDPDLCLKLVPALQSAIAASPGSDAGLGARAAALGDQIRAFDAEAKARLAPLAGRAIVTHHSAWGRLAGHYGLTVAAVIKPIETAEETSGAVDAVIAAIRTQHIAAIFIEPQFSPRAADRIGEQTGVAIGVLDPLGDGDWFRMMRNNIDALVTGLQALPK